MKGNENKINKSSNSKKLRTIDLLIIIIFLLVAVISLELFRRDLMHSFKLQNVEPVGTVVVRKNTVQRRLGDRILWDRLTSESPVYFWDIIRVSDHSAATLYVGDSNINLDENTLVRIVPSPDGEGVMIVLSQGDLSIAAGENSSIVVDVNGQRFKTERGTLFRTSVDEDGQVSFQAVESIDDLIRSGTVSKVAGPELFSPAANSVYRLNNNQPSIRFQWDEIEGAVSYVLEVSAEPDFSEPSLRRQTSSTFISDSSLEQGLWFWRVMPVFPTVFSGYADFSQASFFSVERADNENTENLSLAEFLTSAIPPSEVPDGVPRELIPAHLTAALVTEPEPQQPIQPAPARQPPPALLAAPQNSNPANGTNIGSDQLQEMDSLIFNWSEVQGANAYIFTLYHQSSSGRRQITRATINRGTSYALENMQLLDKGTFVWQVEPVRQTNGRIEQRGRITENRFNVDFPSPTPVFIEETGIIYGD